ncbi:MAG TPA: nucleic acid-binding protein [Cyanobacteria bacterium UBA11372]|nr:nucleic acid-binding protein [Cyanobacteria bacterium UBA11372]
MTRTFIDSGVLIAAARGNTTRSFAALSILNDRDREFASSAFVQLETIPKATYYKQQAEVDFYESFFSSVTLWATKLDEILQTGNRIASSYGLAAMDAHHLAAALTVDAEEFVTTEKTTKPMHRVTEIRVVSIASELL